MRSAFTSRPMTVSPRSSCSLTTSSGRPSRWAASWMSSRSRRSAPNSVATRCAISPPPLAYWREMVTTAMSASSTAFWLWCPCIMGDRAGARSGAYCHRRDRRAPVGELVIIATNDLGIAGFELTGDRTGLAIADRTVVNFQDRGQVGGGSRHEALLAGEELRARDWAL